MGLLCLTLLPHYALRFFKITGKKLVVKYQLDRGTL